MTTWLSRAHTTETQMVEQFTGEGAYHGSTQQKTQRGTPQVPMEVVPEAQPTTLERYLALRRTTIDMFDGLFPNQLTSVDQLNVPSQEEVRNDAVTFCWCPLEQALQLAGPLTRKVLNVMRLNLSRKKRNVYIDSKIQYFEPGDLPVDSYLWHVDGSIAVRDKRVRPFGVSILHDMRARLEHGDPPQYMAYQSSDHCATDFLDTPLRLLMPELVTNFTALDAAVQAANVSAVAHRAGAVLKYNGLTLHRPTRATSKGWRLWIRCTETNVEIRPSENVVSCYGKVYR